MFYDQAQLLSYWIKLNDCIKGSRNIFKQWNSGLNLLKMHDILTQSYLKHVQKCSYRNTYIKTSYMKITRSRLDLRKRTDERLMYFGSLWLVLHSLLLQPRPQDLLDDESGVDPGYEVAFAHIPAPLIFSGECKTNTTRTPFQFILYIMRLALKKAF